MSDKHPLEVSLANLLEAANNAKEDPDLHQNYVTAFTQFNSEVDRFAADPYGLQQQAEEAQAKPKRKAKPNTKQTKPKAKLVVVKRKGKFKLFKRRK